jgi:hypothetical protein
MVTAMLRLDLHTAFHPAYASSIAMQPVGCNMDHACRSLMMLTASFPGAGKQLELSWRATKLMHNSWSQGNASSVLLQQTCSKFRSGAAQFCGVCAW